MATAAAAGGRYQRQMFLDRHVIKRVAYCVRYSFPLSPQFPRHVLRLSLFVLLSINSTLSVRRAPVAVII